MKAEVIRKVMQPTSTWAGGTTTELYLEPKGSEYAKRDFLFRISTAVCNNETSVFTSLPGVKRILMVLGGQVKLAHRNHHEVILQPFEQDTFLGDWETVSTGTCTDFNLMLRENSDGTLQKLIVTAKEITVVKAAGQTGFYLYDGRIKLQYDQQQWILEKEDFIMISPDILDDKDIMIQSLSNQSVLVQVNIEMKY